MCIETRTVEGSLVVEAIRTLYSEACTVPDPRVESLLLTAFHNEQAGPGRDALEIELENFQAARDTGLPICQDTGTAVVFIELGCAVCVSGGTLGDLVNEGVRRACMDMHLRPSQVCSPAGDRTNTMDNTPAVLHLEHVEGHRLKISLLAKGAGCENVSRSEMLPPFAGGEGISALAEKCVISGASRACAPVILGIGVGGTLEVSGILAKKALLREVGLSNPNLELDALEKKTTARLNATGIGPQGFGGISTVLETRILTLPCHMASLPVTVCVECHVHRTASCEI